MFLSDDDGEKVWIQTQDVVQTSGPTGRAHIRSSTSDSSKSPYRFMIILHVWIQSDALAAS